MADEKERQVSVENKGTVEEKRRKPRERKNYKKEGEN